MTKSTKTKYLSASLVLGLIFLFLSFLVNKDIFHNLDYDTLITLQNTFGRFVDLPFSILTLLGSTEMTLTTTGVIFLLIFIKRRKIFIETFLILAIYIIEFIGKIFIFHPKPPLIFNRYALDIFLPSSFVVQTSFSYPSGHMARVTFLTLVISFLLLKLAKQKFQKTLISITAAFLIFFMFTSRIYLGEHWLSDVLGGFLLGASVATFALSLW